MLDKEAPDKPGEEEDDFRKYCSKKAKIAKESCEDPTHHAAVIQTVWIGEQIEWLSNALQHHDEAGSCILKACARDGLVAQVEIDLFRRGTSSMRTPFGLQFLTHHVQPDPDIDAFEFQQESLAKCMSVAAQVWARIASVLQESPWTLLSQTGSNPDEAF